MSTKVQFTAFSGIDRGSQSHQVFVSSSEGVRLDEKEFPHSGEGIHQLLDWISACAGCEPANIAVGIEAPHGPIVDA